MPLWYDKRIIGNLKRFIFILQKDCTKEDNALLYPLLLKAPLKDYIWGGTKRKTEYNKETSLETVAESWELACHKDGRSIIMNGEAAGMELSQYIALKGDRIVGSHGARYSYFPLLIKLLDSAQDLSVQVHPDNEYALRVEGEYGKTEYWYVVDAEPGASLIYGLNREVTKDELRGRIEDHTLLDVCNRVSVKPGDAFMIEAGTLHSLGGGITVAEIQQNSNTTYRVYDYGRLGKDGNPRKLDIDKALDVLRLKPSPEKPTLPPTLFFAEYDMRQLVSCEYFTVHEFNLHGRCHLRSDMSSFHSIMVLDGVLEIDCRNVRETLEKGASVFIPADYGAYWLRGEGKFLLTTM